MLFKLKGTIIKINKSMLLQSPPEGDLGGLQQNMKNKFKYSLLLSATLLLAGLLGSCVSETCELNPNPNYPDYNIEEMGEIAVSLRIVQQQPETMQLHFGTEQADDVQTRGVSRPICDTHLLDFNTGDLYLVSAAGTILRHYSIVSGPGILDPDGSGRLHPDNRATRTIHRHLLGDGRAPHNQHVVLYAVPAAVTRIVIAGNTSPNAISGSINQVGARVLDVVSQSCAWNVNLFGDTNLPRNSFDRLATPTTDYTHTAHVRLEPNVARIELSSITGMEGCIASFKIEGIFIDGYYRNARVDGTARSSWRNKENDPALFVQGSSLFPFNLRTAIFDWFATPTPVAGGVPATPALLGATPTCTDPNHAHNVCTATTPCTSAQMAAKANVWSYQLFAAVDPNNNAASATPRPTSTPPRIIIRLRDVELVDHSTGGTILLDGPQFVTVNLYDPQNPAIPLAGITASWIYRLSVVFDRNDLEPTPNPPPATSNTNARVTAYVNVMYDFQHQRLESFVTSGPAPVAWQWQVATSRNGTYVNIPNATSATWTIPQDFIHNPIYNGINQLYFRVVMTFPDGTGGYTRGHTPNANALGMRFIRTTVQGEGTGFRRGFGKDVTPCGQTVRWAEMGRARHQGTGSNTIRVALLNVGATDNDGVGLGYSFQWGRRADGHQLVGWYHTPTNNRDTRATPGVTGANLIITSAVVAHTGIVYNADGQPDPPISSFISAGGGDWNTGNISTNASLNLDLWGGGTILVHDGAHFMPVTVDRVRTPISSDDWTERAQRNNPCPPGWRVPSRHDWYDMYRGNGIAEPTTTAGGFGFQTNSGNHWYPLRETAAGAIGGVIVRNTHNDATIFLATARARGTAGTFATTDVGRYWSSTQHSNRTYALTLEFRSTGVSLPVHGRSQGNLIRCVADE